MIPQLAEKFYSLQEKTDSSFPKECREFLPIPQISKARASSIGKDIFTMGDSFLPSNEATLVQWANNLVSYAVTHTAQTGLSTAVVTEFTARRNDFQNSILLTETSKSAYRANVKTKKLKQKSIRPLARVGYKNVPDSKTAVLRTKFPCSLRVRSTARRNETCTQTFILGLLQEVY